MTFWTPYLYGTFKILTCYRHFNIKKLLHKFKIMCMFLINTPGEFLINIVLFHFRLFFVLFSFNSFSSTAHSLPSYKIFINIFQCLCQYSMHIIPYFNITKRISLKANNIKYIKTSSSKLSASVKKIKYESPNP